jgi:hypothetical protein
MQRLQLNRIMHHAHRMGNQTPTKLNHQMAATIYESINRAVFGGVLRRPKIIIRNYKDFWGETEGSSRGTQGGTQYVVAMRLHREWPNMKKLITVIAHEMVHQYEWERQQQPMSHGSTFWDWQHKLMSKGIRLCVVM